MVIVGKAVLAFGIVSVFGAAVHNNHRANAASPPVVTVETAAAFDGFTSSARELPRGYLTNPATSPLAGFTPAMVPPARPILRSDTYPVAPPAKSEVAFSDDGRRLALK
ncbi:MAG TPA: hypothetical protein VFF19_15660 [Reyranella sp.]|jgi:hypothetical protein|nr:hypothetical protein [Reyranella sp.]